MPVGLVEEVEDVIQAVADWAIKSILESIDRFTVNSGPFDYVKLTPEEQIKEYLLIRGNAQAWYSRIETTAQKLIGDLKSSGVPEEEILKLSPYNIAFIIQAKYDQDMTKLLEKRYATE